MTITAKPKTEIEGYEEWPIGIAISDREFRLLKVNNVLRQFLGYSKRDLAKRTFLNITNPAFAETDIEYLRKLISGEMPVYRTEKSHTRKNQETVWAVMTIAAVHSTDGNSLYYLALIEDITERKRMDQALRRIEWLLSRRVGHDKSYMQAYGDLVEINACRMLIDSVGKGVLHDIVNDCLDLLDTSAAVYEKNGDYALGLFTSGWCRFLDQASHRLCGTDDNRAALASGTWHCHESCWTEASKVAIETCQPVDVECRGGIRLYAIPISAGDQVIGSMNFGYGDPPQDPRKLREIAARYGVSLDELSQQAKAYESRPPFIIDLAKRRLRASARLIGEIFERKQAEEELRKNREHLEELVKQRTEELRNAELKYRTVADFTYDWEDWSKSDGTFVYVSPSCERISGFRPQEFMERSQLFREVILAEDRNMWDRHFQESRHKHGPHEIRFRIRRRDGEIRWIEHVCQPIWDVKGRFLGIRGSNRDITERKQAEEALTMTEANLKRAQEVAKLGSWYLDLDKGELFCSDEVYQIFAMPLGKSMNYESFLELIHPDDRLFVERKWAAALDGESYDIEHRIIANGQVKWIRHKEAVEFDDKKNRLCAMGIIQDITERKEAEEDARRLRDELAHIMRVATMGELAASLAHEINQPLTAILSNAQAVQRFLLGDAPDLEEVRDALKDIIKDDQRAGDVIRRLRAILKKGALEQTSLDIDRIIQETLTLLNSEILEQGISISSNLASDLPIVVGDRVQLQQVIVNLLVNAFEATRHNKPGTKTIIISTAVDEPGKIKVSITDPGSGIAPENIGLIFKPFFTTKPEGIGMGLSISHSIIEAHGGRLWAINNPDRGATFYFTLPIPREDVK